jgi:quercetin 2,3-dioxygenase
MKDRHSEVFAALLLSENRMITYRDRMTRGRTHTGWLDSRHTFSFADYNDPTQMGFRTLRVINEDRVIPGAGFPSHSHKDMDILTYVLAGSLEHKDSLGNGAVILPGDLQRMSAGTGIIHSEFNASKTEPVHFLQIWIIPNQERLSPSYEQRTFPVEERRGRLRLVASKDGQGGSVTIHQDLRLFVAGLVSGDSVAYQTARGHGLWLQVARGIIALNGTEMREGDGAAIQDEETIAVEAYTDAEILLFDLA